MNTLSPAILVITGLYYGLACGITFFSLFGIYVLLRYGKNRSFSMGVSIVYILLYAQTLAHSHQLLLSLR